MKIGDKVSEGTPLVTLESKDDPKEKPKVETKLKIEEKKEESVVIKQSESEIIKEKC